MRVWRFYLDKSKLKVNEDVAFVTLKQKISLYAITNSKEKAKRFIAERNMDLFIMRKGKIEEEEWTEYAGRHRGCILTLTKLTTRKEPCEIEHPDTIDDITKMVDMLITIDEKTRIESFSQSGDDLCILPIFQRAKDMPCPNIFNRFMEGILRFMGYHLQYDFMFGYENPAYIQTYDNTYTPGTMYSFGGEKEFYFDELTMFIWEYGELYDVR